MRNSNVKSLCLIVCLSILAATVSAADQVCAVKIPDNAGYNPPIPVQTPVLGDKDYPFRLMVYIVEPLSNRWFDYDDDPYRYAFLNFALDTSFTLGEAQTLSKTVLWDGSSAGYPDITENNIMAIAVLYNMSQSYPASSDTIGGHGAPFNAYYIDAAAAATPDRQWGNTTAPGFTHSVFVEYGTTTYCPACPAMSDNLALVYQTFDLPFFYASMVADVNTIASNWVHSHFNLHWVPTCYYDGGDTVHVGAQPYTNIISAIEDVGARAVTTFGLTISLDWLGESRLEMQVNLARNDPPTVPLQPDGVDDGVKNVVYQFTTNSTDPDDNQLYYNFVWNTGDTSGWYGPYNSGDPCTAGHSWTAAGTYNVKARAKDTWGFISDWSDVQQIEIHDYLAGDANGNLVVNILDITYLINFVYKGGPAPVPMQAGDANASGVINILDITYLINYVYKGGPAPLYPD
jgi:hypothetical protein